MQFGDNVAVEFATGAGAAVIDCCIFHSVDTLKVRAQDRRPLLPWATLQSTARWKQPSVAVRSLYQGFSTNLALKVPYMSAMFGFHALNRSALASIPPSILDVRGRELLSAMLVGVEASLLLAPLELIRIQGQNKNRGELPAASRYVFNRIGLRGLLTCGMHACMQREAKYCIGQFALIGAVSSQLAVWSNEHKRSSQIAARLSEHSELRILLSSISVGFMCTIISHADDVVKTRQQTRMAIPGRDTGPYRSYVSSIRHVATTEGVSGLLNGWVWRCCLRVPLGLAVVNFVHPWLRPQIEAAFDGTN